MVELRRVILGSGQVPPQRAGMTERAPPGNLNNRRGESCFHCAVTQKCFILRLPLDRRQSWRLRLPAGRGRSTLPPQAVLSDSQAKILPRVSLRDIANSLGLNHSTVSRALRNKARVSKELRLKIQQAAVELGYRPDPMLSALAHYRQSKTSPQISSVIAWINGWPNPKALRNYKEFDAYWRGACGAAEKLGYKLEEFDCNPQMPPARLEKILRARNVGGVLIPPQPDSFDWNGFHWDAYSVARFCRGLGQPPLHLITADQVSNVILAFQRIRERGYKRIGFLTGRASEGGAMFETGFLVAQRYARSELTPLPPLSLEEVDARADEREVKRWLRLTKPDAILTDVASAGSLLAKAGVRVPDDVGLAALSVLDGNADAGVYQNPGEIGRVGVLLVTSLINDGARGIPPIFRQILIAGEWVDGSSLPPR
jgi:LacI family transcriptional regulator